MSNLLLGRTMEARFVPAAPVQKTVGVTAVQVLNGDRQGPAFVFNNGLTTVYIGTSNAVTAATGIPIGPSSGLWLLFDRAAWWGIGTANTDVRVCEWGS